MTSFFVTRSDEGEVQGRVRIDGEVAERIEHFANLAKIDSVEFCAKLLQKATIDSGLYVDWRRSSDEMPPGNIPVLMSYDGPDLNGAEVWFGFWARETQHWCTASGRVIDKVAVTHWAPLPAKACD